MQTGAAAPPGPPGPATPVPPGPKTPSTPAAKQQMGPPWKDAGPKKDAPAHDAKQPPTKAMPKYAAAQNKQVPVKAPPPEMKIPKQPSGPPPSAKPAVILQIFKCSVCNYYSFLDVSCYS